MSGNPSPGRGSQFWRNLPLRTKACLVLLVPVAAFLLNNAVSYAVDHEQNTAHAWVKHTLDVRVELQKLSFDLFE